MKSLLASFIIMLFSCGATTSKQHEHTISAIQDKITIPVDTLYTCIKEAATLFSQDNNSITSIQQIFTKRNNAYKIVSGNDNSDDAANLVYSLFVNEPASQANALKVNIPDILQDAVKISELVKIFGPFEKPSGPELAKKEYFNTRFYYKAPQQKDSAVIIVTSSFPYNSDKNKIFYITLQKI